MNDQDKRAVEGLARSGIDLDGLCDAFPKFPREDIVKIYDYIRNVFHDDKASEDIKRNCS